MSQNYWDVDKEALYKQMFKEFKRTKEDLSDYINIMREWVKTQPHFPEVPSDCLLRFLVIVNKFNIEKTKQKLDMYYSIRSLIPELYSSSPLSSESALQSRIIYAVPLPKHTPDFKRIIYAQINPKYEPAFFIQEKIFSYCLNVIELIILEDLCLGSIVVMDCYGIQLGHIPKLNPLLFKKAAVILEKVYSNRLAGIYVVNMPKYLEGFLNNVIKPLLNPKIRGRLKINTGTEILLKEFGKSRMPKDIGGEERSLDELTDCVLMGYEARKDRFEVLHTLRVDESLRPQKLVNDDVLGYYGNFKKINVD